MVNSRNNYSTHLMTKSYNEVSKGDDAPSFAFNEPKPLFFSEEELFVASGMDISVYNPLGGRLLYVLKGHKHKVVSICKSGKSNDKTVVSCDEKANVFYWPSDRTNSNDVSSITLPLKVTSVSHFSIFNETYIVSYLSARMKVWVLCVVTPPYLTLNNIRTLSKEVFPGHNTVAVNYDGKFLAAIRHKELVIVFLEHAFLKQRRTPWSHTIGEFALTCVAFHPSKDVLATGDSRGSIWLWFQFIERTPVKVVLHWHTMPVRDMCFSSTGVELYSGGDECVLVRWNLKDDNHKSFLPRLGMPIRALAALPSGSHLVLHHVDQTLNIVNAREMRFIGSVQKLSVHVPVGGPSSRPLPAGLLYHAPTNTLVKNGKTGHLQFFNADSQLRAFDLDISMCNFATQERHQVIPNPEIAIAVMSPRGDWMVTAEVCQLTATLKEIVIKFWSYSLVDGLWSVNTSVQTPHTDTVTSISLHGSGEPICVSCSEDGTFKLWKLITYHDVAGKTRQHWNSRYTREYRGHPATASAFAADGSLVAVAFERAVTLWNPEDASFVGTLSQDFIVDRIVDIVFSQSKHEGSSLVTRSKSWLCSWDLLSCCLVWRVFIQATCLALDPKTSLIAVFSTESEVFFVDPHSSQPRSSLTQVSQNEVICALFAPPSSEGKAGGKGKGKGKRRRNEQDPWNRLYFFDAEQNFLSLEHPLAAKIADSDTKTKQNYAELTENNNNNDDNNNNKTSDMFSALVAKSRKKVPPKEKEEKAELSLQAPSVNSLVKDLKNLTIPSITFEGLLEHMTTFLPDLSSKKDGDETTQTSLKYTTIKEERKKERTLSKSFAVSKEELVMEAIQKFDHSVLVKKIHS